MFAGSAGNGGKGARKQEAAVKITVMKREDKKDEEQKE
jgi:hypothetical protein